MIVRLMLCVVAALPAGWFAGVLIDRVPDRLPLAPLPAVRLTGKYLWIHVLMIGLFALAAVRFEDASPGVLVGYLLLFAVLLTVSVIDIELYRLPDLIVLPTLAISLVLIVVVSIMDGAAEQIRYALVGAAMYFGFLLLAHLVYPRGMGFGDVKLAAVMGLYVGWLGSSTMTAIGLVLWAMLLGFIGGAIVGMVMLAVRRRSQPIPFGPFLALGTIIAVLASSSLVSPA
ncbi:prepilin peptidase [Rhabdothermincola sp.]|uniref:prepilin peptidase n=1 Tax=Rhabdothermincola sp. TaxID=2820405 RepID=UPI002FE161AD